jgi:SPP1 gp7 family putative phage head morphogenesis protein
MSLPADINDFLDPILATFNDELQLKIQGYLVTAYLRGSAQMTSWGRTKLEGKPLLFEGPPMQEAIEYANKHCATLVKGLNQETRERLAKVISDGIKDKRGIDGLARDLRKEFDGMSKYRSQVIARNETATALEQSFYDRGKAMGITGKEWVTAGDDRVSELCLANEAAGVIPFNQPFPSGHMTPPGHIQCRCACAPVML